MAKSKVSSRGLWAIAFLRISLGLIFLWAFFDKLFGLGFSTCRDAKTNVVATMCDKAWINGGSPTDGFLKNGTKGPLADYYHNLAGKQWVAWLFMTGLLLLGLALVLGIGLRIAAITGSILMLKMWAAALPPANNPVIDDHIVYIFALFAIALANGEQKLGLGNWWAKQKMVSKYPILR